MGGVSTLVDIVAGIATFVGTIVIVGGLVAGTVYLYTHKPTPAYTLREAVGEIRWGYGIVVFVLPPSFVGLQEGTLLGFILGAGFLLYIFLLAWWTGI